MFNRNHDSGQATTEYALVLLGAAVIALLVIAWATDGGGAGRIGELFDKFFVVRDIQPHQDINSIWISSQFLQDFHLSFSETNKKRVYNERRDSGVT